MERQKLDLLKPEISQKPSLAGSFFQWSVKIGRVIIIFTELVVLAVFFARFKLDRDLLDLSNSIRIKLEVLATVEEFEKDFRDVQEKLEMVRAIHEKRALLSNLVKDAIDRFPQEITLDHLDIRESSIDFSAKAPSGAAFAKLIQELKKIENAEEIILGSSRFDPKARQYIFSISVELGVENNV